MPLKLMYITNKPQVALIAQKYGVDRVWVDLETLGKEERQKNLDCVKSHHTVSDVEKLSKILTTSELMVRVNPWNENSYEEIEQVINAGAQIIMLPMWKTTKEVELFLDAVGGRCKTSLLLETKEGEEIIDQVLAGKLPDEMHIGLNDLHLSKGMTFMFELLANGTVEKLCKKIKAAGIPYGFGGIAKIGQGDLPAEKVITEHYRLGSTRAILSRSFCNTDLITDEKEIEEVFSSNMRSLREFEQSLTSLTEEDFSNNALSVKESVQTIVTKIKEKRK